MVNIELKHEKIGAKMVKMELNYEKRSLTLDRIETTSRETAGCFLSPRS